MINWQDQNNSQHQVDVCIDNYDSPEEFADTQDARASPAALQSGPWASMLPCKCAIRYAMLCPRGMHV